jgi:hypothetical protein
LEIPSDLAGDRFDARMWIARIKIGSGLLSAGKAFAGDAWSV